jgi:hypothetical protein
MAPLISYNATHITGHGAHADSRVPAAGTRRMKTMKAERNNLMNITTVKRELILAGISAALTLSAGPCHADGPNSVGMTVVKEGAGNLAILMIRATEKGGPGFGHTIAKYSLAGITSVNGKPLAGSPQPAPGGQAAGGARDAPSLEIVFEPDARNPRATQLAVFADGRVDYGTEGKLILQTRLAAETREALLDFLQQKGLPRSGKAVVAGAEAKVTRLEMFQWLHRRSTPAGAKQAQRHEQFQALCREADVAAQEDPLLKRAEEVVRVDHPGATVRPVQSRNYHLGIRLMPQPLARSRYYAATLAYTTAAPVRTFVEVLTAGGREVLYPLTLEQFIIRLQEADKSTWTDRQYLDAAMLYVHLNSVANEDGWVLLEKPEDFTAISFNMDSVGPGPVKRHEAAVQIRAPVVEALRSDPAATRVTFFSWHLVGGSLRKWEVEIGEAVAARHEDLGRFGGGGYD